MYSMLLLYDPENKTQPLKNLRFCFWLLTLPRSNAYQKQSLDTEGAPPSRLSNDLDKTHIWNHSEMAVGVRTA